MPKTSGIPKSLLADIKSLKTKLAALEKNVSSVAKDSKSTMSMIKSHAEMLKKHQSTIAQQGSTISQQESTISQQESTIAQLGKKSVKKEKRKPSEYNLFLKGKMTQGMSMIDAVKAWKQKDSSSMGSSTRETSQDYQSPTQQY